MPHEDVNCRADRSPYGERLQPHSTTLVIVGSGALGAQICLEFIGHLHHLIGSVTLIDPDVLEEQNVPSSDAWRVLVTHFSQQVIGNYKADILASYCRDLAPHIKWSAITFEIADVGWKVLQSADIIITCTDSVVSRMEATYAARMLGKPMLDAGVMGQDLVGGRVAWYAPHTAAACYGCGLIPATRSAVLEYMASTSLSCSTLPLVEAMGSSPEGATSVTLVARLLMQQLPYLVNANQSCAVRVSESGTETVSLSTSPGCPWHHRPKLVSLHDDAPIRAALAQDEVLLLPWPIALTAICDTCGTQQDTPTRVAKLRKEARCSHCGASTLQPERIVDRIVFDDKVAEHTPLQIGLPAGNVFPARKRILPQRIF